MINAYAAPDFLKPALTGRGALPPLELPPVSKPGHDSAPKGSFSARDAMPSRRPSWQITQPPGSLSHRTFRRRFDVYHLVTPIVTQRSWRPKLSPREKVNVDKIDTVTEGESLNLSGQQHLSAAPQHDEASYFPLDGSFSIPEEFPLSVLRALQSLPQAIRPSSKEIRDMAAALHVSLREALSIILVGEARFRDLQQRANDAKNGVLKLCLWLQPNGNKQRQILAAALALLHCSLELDLEDCDPSDCALLSPWLALRKLKLHGCIRLASLDGLQHCTYLEEISLRNCTALKHISTLRYCTQLKHIDLDGCMAVNPAEIWELALQSWLQAGCAVVWPSVSVLKSMLQQHRLNRLATESVLKSAVLGARQQLQRALEQRNASQFQKAIMYAKSLDIDVQDFEAQYMRMKMETLLSEEDVAILIRKNSRTWKHRCARAAALASWMSVRKTGLTFVDFQRALDSVGYTNPHCSTQYVYICILQGGETSLQRSALALLDGTYKGPATIIEAIDMRTQLLEVFGNVDNLVSYLFDTPYLTLKDEEVHQKLEPKMGGKLSLGHVASLVKLLDYSRDGLLKEPELRRLELLNGITNYKKMQKVVQALSKKYGGTVEGFHEIDSNRSGSISYQELVGVLDPAECGFDKNELSSMFLLVDDDGTGIISKNEWEKMLQLASPDDIVRDLRALYAVICKQFTGTHPVSDAFQSALAWAAGNELGRGGSKRGSVAGNDRSSSKEMAEKRGSVAEKRGSVSKRSSVSKDRNSIVNIAERQNAITLQTFEGVLGSWGFTGGRLTPRELFNNVFDCNHQGTINEDEFKLLEFFGADDVRTGVQHLQSFLKQRCGMVESAYTWMFEIKREHKKAQQQEEKEDELD